MFKKFAFALAVAAALPASALTTGDIAFTAFNADEDGWSLVTFVDIAAGSTVYFSDNTYAAGAFANTESFLTWSTGAGKINAGTVVRFIGLNDGANYTGVSASVGSLVVTVDGNAGLSATAETLYAYQGASHTAPVTFLSAVSSEANLTSLTNAGLTAGTNAVKLTSSTDYAGYTGMRAGELAFAAYAPMVNNASNWAINVGGNGAAVLPSTVGFTVSAVPEPESYALMLAGLAAIGLLVARRRA